MEAPRWLAYAAASDDMVTQFANFIGERIQQPDTENTREFLCAALATASGLITKYIAACEDVPDTPLAQALLITASEVYSQRRAPNGVRSFGGDVDGAVIRVSRDPMVATRAMLKPYLVGGFA